MSAAGASASAFRARARSPASPAPILSSAFSTPVPSCRSTSTPGQSAMARRMSASPPAVGKKPARTIRSTPSKRLGSRAATTSRKPRAGRRIAAPGQSLVEALVEEREGLQAPPGRLRDALFRPAVGAGQGLRGDGASGHLLQVVEELGRQREELVGGQEVPAAQTAGLAAVDLEQQGRGIQGVDGPLAPAQPLAMHAVHEGVHRVDAGREKSRAFTLGQGLAQVIARPPFGEDDPVPGVVLALRRQAAQDRGHQALARRDEDDTHSTASQTPRSM